MEEIKNFINSHSSPNGCVALTRSERDELLALIKVIDDEREVALENWNTVLDERNALDKKSLDAGEEPKEVFINKDTPMLPYYDQGKELHRIADALETLASTVNERGNFPRLLVSNNGN